MPHLPPAPSSCRLRTCRPLMICRIVADVILITKRQQYWHNSFDS
jgi:hypothetical protein